VRITIFASGSRGDVQPLVALALGLQAAGHVVTVAAPRNFGDLVRQRGLSFHAFAVDVEELMRSDLGRAWLGHSSHSPAREVWLVSRLVREWAAPMAEESLALAGTADLFVSGVMTLDVVDALVSAGGGAHVVALLAPFHASRSGPVGLRAPRPAAQSRLNLLAGIATAAALGAGFGSPGLAARRSLGLASRGVPSFGAGYRRSLLDTPTVLGASPLVVPPPADWPAWVRTTGYWFLPTPSDWTPQPQLADFLAAGDAPVYVGFGSMSTRDAQGTLRTIVAGLRRSGRRGLIHSGGADLGEEVVNAALDRRVLMVGDVPHDWLFPRMAAVIHHGGAGTTAAGLRAGVPSAIVPHIGDQPYWGRRVADLGVGADPVPRHRMTADRLAAMIEQMSAGAVRSAARDLGERIRAERGVANAVSFIERFG
jgi:sterol 3beta-glucosyltransferase